MKSLAILLCVVLGQLTCACSHGQVQKKEKLVGGPCDGCNLIYEGMPSNPNWSTVIADTNEPGEPLTISGTIYRPDGKTPAAGVMLYVYHTDSTGRYSPAPNQDKSRRHGHLRGWMKTDEQGRYLFNTIRPAAYPNRTDPQHIHPLIKEEGKSVYWIDEFLFEDDPLVTDKVRSQQEKRGGSGIIILTKNPNGVWVGNRDIILGLNIPNY
jgi:protocatechuate 3,4-dioxygenase beta subunit